MRRRPDILSDAEIVELIHGSSENLSGALAALSRLRALAPRLAALHAPVVRRLACQQAELERTSGIGTVDSLGSFIITAAVIGGMSLLGIGTWAWKQHEETSLERDRLELMENCITEKTAGGMARGEAERTCARIYTGAGGGIMESAQDVLKLSIIGGVLVLGLYAFIRWKT